MGVNGYGVHGAVRLEQMPVPAYYGGYHAAGGLRLAPLAASGKAAGYPQQRNHHNPAHQPRQFHHYRTMSQCDQSLSLQGTATSVSGSFKPGMKDVPQWLKSLRLHKYTALFETLSYAEMMALNEAQLQRRDVTQGARRKILQSIQRLRDRPRVLLELDARLRSEMSVDAVRDAIDELRAVLGTPIGAYTDQRTAPCLPACILRLLARVYGVLFKPAMDSQTSAWYQQAAGELLPEIEDEHVVRLAQVCDRIFGHEAFEAGEKQQVASYRNALRRYIQKNGIRPTPVAADYKAKSRNVTKPLSHSNSFLYDASTVGHTAAKFAGYRRANSETCSTPTAASITNPISALALLNDSQRAHLRNWMLLLRDYHVSQILSQDVGPQCSAPRTTGLVGQRNVPTETGSCWLAEELDCPTNPSPTDSRGSAAESLTSTGQLLDSVIGKFGDVWRPINDDVPTTHGNKRNSARPMAIRTPTEVPTIPSTAPKSPSNSAVAVQPDYPSCAFSCSSVSDRSSGACSPMVYDFFGDEPPFLELTFDKPRRYCSGYGSLDDGSGVEEQFGTLLSRQNHYKLFY